LGKNYLRGVSGKMGNIFRARSNEKVSLTRVMSFMVVTVILTVFLAWNIRAIIKRDGTYVTLGSSEVYLMAIALGAKVAQNVFGEKTPAPDKSEKKPTKEDQVNGPG
jgi:hypothetical protein